MQTPVSTHTHTHLLLTPRILLIPCTDNLDQEQAVFLKRWFPDEVKTKQRYNELMAGVDQYGEVYASEKCVIM